MSRLPSPDIKFDNLKLREWSEYTLCSLVKLSKSTDSTLVATVLIEYFLGGIGWLLSPKITLRSINASKYLY